MTDFIPTQQKSLFPVSTTCDHQFVIRSNLLYDCIGYGPGSSFDSTRVTGFSYGKVFGYALLTYFAGRALNFRRLPFCEDRIYADETLRKEYEKTLIRDLDEATVRTICDELAALYQHTQTQLALRGVHTVSLERKIRNIGHSRYLETLVRLKQSAELLQLPSVLVDFDTLNSFGDEGLYFGPVTLQLTFPASQILYCSALVAPRPGEKPACEAGEWVVRADGGNTARNRAIPARAH